LNQGSTIAVAPDTGNVYVSWRQFPLPQTSGCVPAAFQKFVARGGQGYWKSHPEKWPTQGLTLGGISYPKTQLITMMSNPVQADATYTLFYQLIAAKLNYMLNPDGSILPTINQADLWLIANPLGSKPKPKAKQDGLGYAKVLQQYNEGPGPACSPMDPANLIMATRSVNSGAGFDPASAVSPIAAFDQGTSVISFRSTAYPTMTVDASGRVYLAWATRGLATSTANQDPVVGDSRIVITKCDANTSWHTWTPPTPIDQPKVPGHQIKPVLCFAAGKLFMLYYDFRQDLSKNFAQYIADLATLTTRHTVDVRAAVAEPGPAPVFTDYSVLNWKPSDQMSRYVFLMLASDATSSAPFFTRQLQFNPPNLPLFVGGTAPFHGDYVDIAPAPAFVVDGDGHWAFNTEASNGSTLQATWTDNRDVKGPPDGNWKNYVPPANPNSGSTSIYDPNQIVPPCRTAQDAERTGMRNQNVYNTRVSRGLYVAAPGNCKPLGDIQRAFVVYVQNATAQSRIFRLEVLPTSGVSASFSQSDTAQSSLDVEIVAYSSVARTVFVSRTSAQGSVQVNVFEIDGIGGAQVDGGLEGAVVLNPDPTNPDPADSSLLTTELHNPAIMNPAIMNPAIMNPAIMNPAIMNPAIMNPAIMNPAIMNPAIMNQGVPNPAIMNPAIMNPAIMNPAIMNPAIMNPAIMSPAIMNPAIMNPAIMNPAIMNGTLKEVNWQVQNDGNTTTGYTFNLYMQPNPLSGLIYQLLIYRLYMTPVADGCTLKQEAQQELLVNVINPDMNTSLFRNGQLSWDAKQPTFYLNPGEYAIATLMVFPDPDLNLTPERIWQNLNNFHPEDVSAGIIAEAVNSNAPPGGPLFPATATMPSPSIPPLVILTDPGNVPGGGIVGAPYTFTLSASGGTGSGTYGWSLADGTLPPGLSLGSDGKFSGTPTTAGTFTFTVRANDFVQTTTQSFSVSIAAAGSLIFVTQPGTTAAGQNMLVEVQALDPSNAVLPGVTVTLSIGASGCTAGCNLSGNTAITDSNGVAHFDTLSMDRGGWDYTLVASAGPSPVTATSGLFDTVGFCDVHTMTTARQLHTATLLPDGKTLVVGGLQYGNPLSSAELYDPATGTWSSAGSLTTARYSHTAALLPSGKVLVVGGEDTSGELSSAWLYDLATGIWSPAAAMATARASHTATLLPSGKLLVAGGIGTSGWLSSAELYDPTTGAWSTTGLMAAARTSHTATLLPSGKVLVVGGLIVGGYASSGELYDPTTGTWSTTGSMTTPRSQHIAELLPNGKLLVAGGINAGGLQSSAELYDPGVGTWGPAGSLSTARISSTSILLPSGKVLVGGGIGLPGVLSSAELYDPTLGTWSGAGLMTVPRGSHTATLLPGGNVLLVGGLGSGGELSDAELFYPDRLRLVFTIQPGNATAGTAVGTAVPAVQVRAVDKDGNGVSGVSVEVGIVPSSCSSCALTGTNSLSTDINGYATFSNLVATRGGWGYRLFAWSSVPGLMSASGQFNVAGFCESGSMPAAFYLHTSTLLADGKILLAGGTNPIGDPDSHAALYSPNTGLWSPTTSMTTVRVVHTATLLSTGKVLVVGGATTGGLLSSAELYNPESGSWTVTGSMKTARASHTATRLSDGTVLVVGGGSSDNASAELYDPASGTWSEVGSLSYGRQSHAAILLPNGKVLVAGGAENSGGYPPVAELYDPDLRTWTPADSMVAGRQDPAAILLSNGEVLVAGGYNYYLGDELSSAELYDPAADSWTSVGALAEARWYPKATLLPSGEVLVTGGYQPIPPLYLESAELYDPVSQTWSTTGSLVEARLGQTSTLLHDGKVLIAGGVNTGGKLASTELYYASDSPFLPDRFGLISPMSVGRAGHTATRLPSGKILIAGGSSTNTTALASAEIYDPATAMYSPTGPMNAARTGHTATLLSNGKVLIAGGYVYGVGSLSSAELYDPSTGAFSYTSAGMTAARYNHTATLLADGKVFIAGGSALIPAALDSTEVFDPSTGTFAATASMGWGRQEHRATLLPDGKVLITGGRDGSLHTISYAEIYDPTSNSYTTVAMLTEQFNHTSTRLTDGKILIAGGGTNQAEVYDSVTNTFTLTAGTIGRSRGQHTATLLPNGKVLIAGSSGPPSAELYDPAARTFSPTGSMITLRGAHDAVLLPDGTVMLCGGMAGSTIYLSSAEIYRPGP
jgi:N-acetylneuraminic acid mutarotase